MHAWSDMPFASLGLPNCQPLQFAYDMKLMIQVWEDNDVSVHCGAWQAMHLSEKPLDQFWPAMIVNAGWSTNASSHSSLHQGQSW